MERREEKRNVKKELKLVFKEREVNMVKDMSGRIINIEKKWKRIWNGNIKKKVSKEDVVNMKEDKIEDKNVIVGVKKIFVM